MHKHLMVYQLNCFLSATNFCLSQILPTCDTMRGSRGCCQSVELLTIYQSVEISVFSAANKFCTKKKNLSKLLKNQLIQELQDDHQDSHMIAHASHKNHLLTAYEIKEWLRILCQKCVIWKGTITGVINPKPILFGLINQKIIADESHLMFSAFNGPPLAQKKQIALYTIGQDEEIALELFLRSECHLPLVHELFSQVTMYTYNYYH